MKKITDEPNFQKIMDKGICPECGEPKGSDYPNCFHCENKDCFFTVCMHEEDELAKILKTSKFYKN